MGNKGTIVIYCSKTGFTQKYAEWIAEDLQCAALPMKAVSENSLRQYDIIIFGGWLHAGNIKGLKKFKEIYSAFRGKKLIVFATGATPEIPEEIQKMKDHNFPEKKEANFYYFQSGINYEKMKGMDKILMKMFRSMLKKAKDKSESDQKMAETIQNSCDFTDRAKIKPLLECLKEE